MEKMLMVDGNSMLFRAFYSNSSQLLMTSNGIYTNAVYGFAMMFQKAIEMIEPDYVFVAFDAGKHTFRHDMFADYKGGRKEVPSELVGQFQLIREYLDAFNIKWLEMQDIEADDIIGSLAKKYPQCQMHILSSDKDLLQLVDDTTTVWLMRKGVGNMEKMDEEGVLERFGLKPKQIIDLKGLMGDSSDNIPGIYGIGEKTAIKLLHDYNSVENLIDHVDELKGKLKEKIINGKESALLSKKLATIKTDVDLNLELNDCLFIPNYQTLIKYLKSLEMNSLVAKYEDKLVDQVIEKNDEDISINIIKTIDPLKFKDGIAIVFDQTSPSFMDAKIIGAAIANGKECFYIYLEDLLSQLDILKEINIIGYDVKYNYHLLSNTNIDLTFTFDTMVSCFLVNSLLNSWDKILMEYHLHQDFEHKDVYGTEGKLILRDEQMALRYCCQKASNIYELYIQTKDKLTQYDLNKLFYEIEMPLTKVLFKMEKEGIFVDEQKLDEIAQDCKQQIDAASSKIYAYVNHEFNLNSPKQLASVLFDELQLPSGKKRSTSQEVLEKLLGMHPIIELILDYRKWQKIYSTYAQGLKKYIYKDHKIHTTFNQCISETGRLSSSNPNLQNISVRNEEGRMIRKAFLPTKGNVLISSDYSQIELRMLAHMANEKALIEAFNHGLDIHTKTAMDVFGVSKDEVDGDMRRKAKAVNFGIVYGISDFGLATQLHISRKDAKSYIDGYLASYPGIHKYMENIIDYCEEHGYVKTISNRRRMIPEIYNKSFMVKEFGKRAAMNAPIQGSAADLIKIAMINIDKAMEEKGCRSKMILQVHDELIFDVYKEEEELMKDIIREGMEHAMKLKVVLKADCKVGKTWYEAK